SIVLPACVREFGLGAFFGCTLLTSVVLPDSVSEIGELSFYNCTSLTSVHFGAAYTHRTDSFNGTPITNITVSPDNPLYSAVGGCLVEKASGRVVLGGTAAQLPDDGSITAIGKEAFRERHGLTEITLPASVTIVEDYAFYGCTDLISVDFSDGLKVICEYAFYNCGTTSIDIPDSVVELKEMAFNGCSELTTVHIGSGLEKIGAGSLSCRNITELTVSADNPTYYSVQNNIVRRADKTLVCGNASGVIPDDGSVVAIGNYAYYHNPGLTHIVIPDTIKRIGNYAFAHCYNLEEVVLSDGLESIGSMAFYYCNMTAVSIPSTVITVDYRAFHYCESLETVSIAEGVEILGEGALYYCGVTSLVIPSSVIRIGRDIVERCKNLTAVFYAGSESDWNSIDVNAVNAVLNEHLHFYSETEPSGDGNYWHYVDGVPTVW
ncbi:MAG: leucine-rich repeat domain-containing protein, partial [Clostridiales bacterium]|nr:leucine-rich repeat domain-containing protein [Clostridiales bacterium]